MGSEKLISVALCRSLQNVSKRRNCQYLFTVGFKIVTNSFWSSQQELSASAVKQYVFGYNDLKLSNRISQNNEENVTDTVALVKSY